MQIVNAPQGTPEWFKVRAGRITASRICDVTSYLKNGTESAQRRNYMEQIVAERLTGGLESGFVSAEMQWGIENEAFARTAYEMATGNEVDTVGFIIHPTLPYAGGSPDGLVGEDGGVEFKCPKSTTHLRWMREGTIPADHLHQCVWGLAITGRKWWDFASFDPRMPQELQLFRVRIEADPELISAVEKEVVLFNEQVKSYIAKLGNFPWHPYTPRPEEPRPEWARDIPADVYAAFEEEIIP